MIDNVIETMDYPFPNLEMTAKARRNAGVGITGLAHHLAKMGLKYSSKEGKEYLHKLAELHSYCLHRASLRLARERGVCAWADRTKYPEGWTPLETYNQNVDTVVQVPLQFDWEGLRKEIVELGGIRNSVLEAFMPCESSSLASGTPNSLYGVRELKTIKTSDTGKPLRFIAPDLEELKDQYEIAWDIDVRDMLEVYAIFQKFCGQAISADIWIKKDERTGKFSGKKALGDFLYGSWLGVKTCYYTNSQNGGKIEEDDGGCADGVCKM